VLVRARRRLDFAGKTVVISGGSRGLGLELARVFAAEKSTLILLARNEQNLRRAEAELRNHGARVMTFTCDVTDLEQVKGAASAIEESVGAVDVLVNNAGTIQVGPVENMKLQDFQSAMAVHFWGPLYLINRFLPSMRARRAGRIVNIASIGGKVAVPHLTPYSASKFALVGLSQSLRAELLKDGIYVTTVCPGLMRTGSHLNAYFKGQQEREYALFAISNASHLLSISAKTAARKIVEACRDGRAEITLTPQAKALRLIHGVVPGAVSEIFGLVNRALPAADGADGDRAKTGAQSRSPLSAPLLTAAADRAAPRNNELADTAGGSVAASATDANRARAAAACACTHPTHFVGRCQAEVSPPAQLCGDCMENHFQPVDDPAI
jgi:short-subunit dehydrogenase